MILSKAPGKWLPTWGILLFIAMYVFAASCYPGGSYQQPQAQGFSWVHNYWCDLYDFTAHNGMPNQSRPVATVAMIVLCLSFGLIWYRLPALFSNRQKHYLPVRYFGIATMSIAALLFTPFHETIIHLGGICGAIAITWLMKGLYHDGHFRLLVFGLTCLLFSVVNYFIYETRWGIIALPGLQKLTFLLFCGWGVFLNAALVRHANHQH